MLAALPGAVVVRASAFFGPWDEQKFVAHALRALAARERFAAADDVVVSPTYVPDLVNAALDLLIHGESGVWHLATRGETMWADLARAAADCAGVSARTLAPVPSPELGWRAPRPRYSALGGERGPLLRELDDALGRYLAAREAA